jgi:hypothetical protein
LFHRLNRAEAEKYLETRRQQGFNVIQAVILAEMDGLHTPNANGHLPLLGDDPTRPNEFYFRYDDEIIRLAADKGLYIGLLPTWGDKVHGGGWGVGPMIFNAENHLCQNFGIQKIAALPIWRTLQSVQMTLEKEHPELRLEIQEISSVDEIRRYTPVIAFPA